MLFLRLPVWRRSCSILRRGWMYRIFRLIRSEKHFPKIRITAKKLDSNDEKANFSKLYIFFQRETNTKIAYRWSIINIDYLDLLFPVQNTDLIRMFQHLLSSLPKFSNLIRKSVEISIFLRVWNILQSLELEVESTKFEISQVWKLHKVLLNSNFLVNKRNILI